MNNMENRVRYDLVCDKIGFDWANKKMIVRVYDALNEVMNNTKHIKKTWVNIVRSMFIMEGNVPWMNNINVNGYYSTIRKILKDIDVIRYEGKTLVKGSNWDRFYSDEDWSWFITNTNCGGYGEIIK